jgi:fatty acid desaturase
MTLATLSIDDQKESYLPYCFGAICSLFLISMVGIGHNFIHHKQNIFKYCLTLTGFTHDEWQIMHCLSHHIYPNMELDYEAAALEPIGYFLRNKPNNFILTEAIIVFLFIFIQPLNLLLKIFVVPFLRRRMPDFWYLVPSIVFLTFYLKTGDWQYALKLHLFIYGIFGLIFNRVLFCGHRLQELWTEGAERIEDFGEHTMLATNDTDTGVTGFWAYLFLAGFNIHTPHHFFPTADLMAHPRILEIIERVCARKGIKHFQTSRANCFLSLSKGIVNRIPFQRK